MSDCIYRYFRGSLSSDELWSCLSRREDPLFDLFEVFFELFVYSEDDECNYYLYRLLVFLVKFGDRFDLSSFFRRFLDYYGDTYGLDTIYGIIVFLDRRGVADLLSEFPEAKKFAHMVDEYEGLLSKPPKKPRRRLSELMSEREEYADVFLGLGFPRDIVNTHLSRLIRLAIEAVRDHLHHLYSNGKAEYLLFSDGPFGVYGRLRDGLALEFFANRIIDSDIPLEDKIRLAEALFDRHIETAIIPAFPIVKLANLYFKAGINWRGYILTILLGRGVGVEDIFARKAELEAISNFLIERFPPQLAALGIAKVYCCIGTRKKPRIILDKKDHKYKTMFALTVFSLLNRVYKGIDAPGLLRLLGYVSDTPRLTRNFIVNWLLRQKVMVDLYTKSLMKKLGIRHLRSPTINSYINYILEKIPEKLFGTKAPVELQDKVYFALNRVLFDINHCYVPDYLLELAIKLAYEALLKKALRTPLEVLLSSISEPKYVRTALKALRSVGKTEHMNFLVAQIQRYLESSESSVRLEAYKTLYKSIGDPNVLEKAMKDRSSKIKQWARRILDNN